MIGSLAGFVVACLLLSGRGAAAQPGPVPSAAAGGDLALWRHELVAAVANKRAELGMSPVAASATLDGAAQQHAEEMAAGGWFGFTSPAGTSVEARVESAGFAAELVAAKVYRAPLTEAPTTLAERWWKETGSSRQSLFHGGVREVGVGVAASASERFFVFVLASAPAAGALPPSLGADLAARRDAFLAAANALRAQHGLGLLRADPALDRAAQEHAVALLGALRAGRPPSTVADLSSRINPGLTGNPAIMAVGKANAGGSAGYSQKTPGREGSKIGTAALAQAVVVDAMSAAQAVETAVKESLADLLAPGYARLGVGVAVTMEGEAPHVLWVACMTRR